MTKNITKVGKGKKKLIDRRKHQIHISQDWNKKKELTKHYKPQLTVSQN